MEQKIQTRPVRNYTAPSMEPNELLLKIHTATGWRMPKSEMLCKILCGQLQKKLMYDFPGITHDQVETAFLKFGGEENFTGTMSIAIIDRVLKKYYQFTAQENFDQERKGFTQDIEPPTPTQHLHECRKLIEEKYQRYLSGELNTELLPVFIFPILCRDFNVDPDLPQYFIEEAKNFVRDCREENKIRKKDAMPVGKIMAGAEFTNDRLENVCVKLAIRYVFEVMKEREKKENLYIRM